MSSASDGTNSVTKSASTFALFLAFTVLTMIDPARRKTPMPTRDPKTIAAIIPPAIPASLLEFDDDIALRPAADADPSKFSELESSAEVFVCDVVIDVVEDSEDRNRDEVVDFTDEDNTKFAPKLASVLDGEAFGEDVVVRTDGAMADEEAAEGLAAFEVEFKPLARDDVKATVLNEFEVEAPTALEAEVVTAAELKDIEVEAATVFEPEEVTPAAELTEFEAKLETETLVVTAELKDVVEAVAAGMLVANESVSVAVAEMVVLVPVEVKLIEVLVVVSVSVEG